MLGGARDVGSDGPGAVVAADVPVFGEGVDQGQAAAAGVEIIVGMARVSPDGPTGSYRDVAGPLPW